MSDTTIDLSGNTNFVVLKDLINNTVVPRTTLAAVDLTAANGLSVAGSTIYANLATQADLTNATSGHLVDASLLGPILDSKQQALTAGDLIEITGTTINRRRYMDIIQEADIPTRSVQPIGQTASVSALVLEPGNAYKISAVSTNKWLATTATFKETQDIWGLEGHIELFVAGTGYVHTDDNVVLSTPIEPDAVNNCTVRFHDGKAIISVEDTIAGYLVVTATGDSETNGSLAYGLAKGAADNVGEYIAFTDTLSGSLIDLAGVTTYNGEKHVVGNGYSDTVLSGGIVCTNKTTFANLGMNGVIVSSGTLTMGDVYIPNGATVAVSGGALAVEKVTGNGGTIDLGYNTATQMGGTAIEATSPLYASGVIFKNGKSLSSTGWMGNGGCINTASANVTLVDCIVSGNRAVRNGAIAVSKTYAITLSGCSVYANNGLDAYITAGATVIISDSYLDSASLYAGGSAVIKGSAIIGTIVAGTGVNAGSVTISSGASINLISSINPGGGVTFEQGGATIVYSNGASSLKLGDYKVKSIESGGSVVLSGVQATDGVASGGTLTMPEGATAVYVVSGKHLTFSDCVASVYFAPNGTAPMGSYTFGGTCYIKKIQGAESINISSGAVISNASGIATTNTGGIEVTGGTCTVNGVIVESGAYTSIDSNGSATL